MLDNYWPTNSQVSSCIRTEAEELSSYVLQVVHEPMHLRKLQINSGDYEVISDKSEEKLLDHLKLYDRPIPIVGDAGSGKSHLIRLLEVLLKNDPSTEQWIVKRIPKSSSLRQVLEILLEDMQGDIFDDLRVKIGELGDRLKTGDVAEHLIVFMNNRLQDLLESTEESVESIRKSGRKIGEEEKANLKRIKRHAPRENLQSLLSDPNFKERLISPGRCLYNIAKRLTKGSTEEEITENEYIIYESDLDFESAIIDDFAANTKAYIRAQQLNTNAQKRVEVVELLNEILGEACRTAFQQFFQFNSGQFLELFLDIRKNLHGKTLVILVEDMAAINAIERDLIDSLLLESERGDEEQSLCVIKSAIAVTTGYEGYQRRRDTIVSRSGFVEWQIEKVSQNDTAIYERVESFCGRYLNASRYELEDIRIKITESSLPLAVWHDGSIDEFEREALESFGVSAQEYPLFPYNKSALKALTDLNCRNSDKELEFNPRMVLSHILIPILRDYRAQFSKGRFPPPNFLGLSPSATLQNELRITDQNELQRSLSGIAFWGYESADLGTLVHIMPPAVAAVMGMPELARILGDTTPAAKQRYTAHTQGVTTATGGADRNTKKGIASDLPGNETTLADRTEEVDAAFRLKRIDQAMANEIRNELLAILTFEFEYNTKWSCINLDVTKYLKRGRTQAPLIYIPFNTTNPSKTYANFGSEKAFSDTVTSLRYRQFIVALLKKRLDHGNEWSKNLYDDYCRYASFAKQWADDVIPSVVAQIQEESILDAIKPAVNIAASIHPSFLGSSNNNKLNILVSHKKSWEDDLACSTGDEAWDTRQNGLIQEWDAVKKNWISYVAYNDHAFSRDLVKPYIRKVSESGLDHKSAHSAQRRLSSTLGASLEFLAGLSNRDEFEEVFTKMRDIISSMSKAGQFTYPNNELTARKFKNRIDKLLDGENVSKHWIATGKALKIISPFEYESFIKAVSQFKKDDIEPVIDLLGHWGNIYTFNLAEYRGINQANDSSTRTGLETEIFDFIEKARTTLVELASENEITDNDVN